MSTRVRFSQERPGVTYVPSTHNSQSTNLLADIRAKPMPQKHPDQKYQMDACTAASIGDESMLRELLRINANLIVAKNSAGWTPLLYAAYLGHQTVCAFLLDHGALVDEATNSRRQTPLMMAAACGNLNVVRMLLERGANVRLADFEKRQALHYAASCSQNVVVDVLLAAGADPNAQDATGTSPLHEAATTGHELTFLSLLEKGGSLSLKNDRSENCAALACDNPKILQIINESNREKEKFSSEFPAGGPENLTELLEEMDLVRYADQFKKESIDLRIFFELEEEDLKDMKIAFGPRKRMWDVIEKFRQTGIIRADNFGAAAGPSSGPVSPKAADSVTSTFKSIRDINQGTKKYAMEALEALGAGQTDKLRALLIGIIDSVEQITVKISSHA